MLGALGRLDQWVRLADEDQEVNLDQLVTRVAQEKMVPLVFLAHQENRVLKDLQVPKVTVGRVVHLELKVLRVARVPKAKQDLRDLVDRKEARVAMVLMVQKERLERRDQLEKMGHLEILVGMVDLVSPE